ncbi:hypothetical protein SNEBB_002545 [Seison nebaliae]|nr:hypothetical protein SNEBB_002545 [Seison nebaliae]
MSEYKVSVKWNKQVYNDITVNVDDPPEVFKGQLFTLTDVLPEKQKIIYKGKILDNEDWDKFPIKQGAKIIMMGTREEMMLRKTTTETKFIEDITEESRELLMQPAAGLFNIGNTCYMNSVIQMMRTIPEVRQMFLTIAQFGNNAEDNLMKSLKGVFENIVNKNVSYHPVLFHKLLCTLQPMYDERVNGVPIQHDANELFVYLLNILDRRIGNYQGPHVISEFTKKFLGTKFQVQLNCEETGEKSEMSEFEIQMSCFINEDVKYLFSGLRTKMNEMIEKHSEIENKNLMFKKTKLIDRLPAYLSIQLVRFFYKEKVNKSVKILKDIKFPMDLDLYQLCSENLQQKLLPARQLSEERKNDQLNRKVSEILTANDQNNGEQTSEDGDDKFEEFSFPDDVGSSNSAQYELIAVITHKGRERSQGHYMAWTKQEDGKWLMFDDEHVVKVQESDILRLSGGGDYHMAYTLLYGPKKLLKLPKKLPINSTTTKLDEEMKTDEI